MGINYVNRDFEVEQREKLVKYLMFRWPSIGLLPHSDPKLGDSKICEPTAMLGFRHGGIPRRLRTENAMEYKAPKCTA
jgi:hypothetical protein